jgi:hypothetical protein
VLPILSFLPVNSAYLAFPCAQVVTPTVADQIARELEARKKGGWARIDWELVEPPTSRSVVLVQSRIIGADYKKDDLCWVQNTVVRPFEATPHPTRPASTSLVCWHALSTLCLQALTSKQVFLPQLQQLRLHCLSSCVNMLQVFKSKQRFAVYSQDGGLLAGDPASTLTVEDVWVLERPLKQDDSGKWRLAARLSMPGTATKSADSAQMPPADARKQRA